MPHTTQAELQADILSMESQTLPPLTPTTINCNGLEKEETSITQMHNEHKRNTWCTQNGHRYLIPARVWPSHSIGALTDSLPSNYLAAHRAAYCLLPKATFSSPILPALPEINPMTSSENLITAGILGVRFADADLQAIHTTCWDDSHENCSPHIRSWTPGRPGALDDASQLTHRTGPGCSLMGPRRYTLPSFLPMASLLLEADDWDAYLLGAEEGEEFEADNELDNIPGPAHYKRPFLPAPGAVPSWSTFVV
ncbi:hypothetical protein B0H14DRAFT_3142237 [Mycena olivaceomarginata]|nr:hypothetical protein B0H14DRAFT_3142237 [Mycena olivaceomarginata]